MGLFDLFKKHYVINENWEAYQTLICLQASMLI